MADLYRFSISGEVNQIFSTLFVFYFVSISTSGCQVYNQTTFGCGTQNIPVVQLFCNNQNGYLAEIKVQKITATHKTDCPRGPTSEGCDHVLPANSTFLGEVVNHCNSKQSCFVDLPRGEQIPICATVIFTANYFIIQYGCISTKPGDTGTIGTTDSNNGGGGGNSSSPVEHTTVTPANMTVEDIGRKQGVNKMALTITLPTVIGFLLLLLLCIFILIICYRRHRLPQALQSFVDKKLVNRATTTATTIRSTQNKQQKISTANRRKEDNFKTNVSRSREETESRIESTVNIATEDELYSVIDPDTVEPITEPRLYQYQDWSIQQGTSTSTKALPKFFKLSLSQKPPQASMAEEEEIDDDDDDDDEFDDWSDSEFDDPPDCQRTAAASGRRVSQSHGRQSQKKRSSISVGKQKATVNKQTVVHVNSRSKDQSTITTTSFATQNKSKRKISIDNQIYVNCVVDINDEVAAANDETYYSSTPVSSSTA